MDDVMPNDDMSAGQTSLSACQTTSGIYMDTAPGNSILGQAERRRAVERLYLRGVETGDIARAVGCHFATAQNDIAYIKAALGAGHKAEELRASMTNTMLGLAEVAEERYRAGEGKTTEGRLVIDAVARAAKLQGLDETSAEKGIAGAWAGFLDRVGGAGSGDDDA